MCRANGNENDVALVNFAGEQPAAMQHGNACTRLLPRPWPLLAALGTLGARSPRRALLLLALALLAPSVLPLLRAFAASLCTDLTGVVFAGCSATTRAIPTSVSGRAGRAAARLPPCPAAPARAPLSAECCRDSSDVHRCAFDAQRTKFKTTCKNFKYYIDRIMSSKPGRAAGAGAVGEVIQPARTSAGNVTKLFVSVFKFI